MALNNALVQKKEPAAVFNANGKEVKLTANIVKQYLVSGDSMNITAEEIAMFINLCKYNNLNPWLKEAYLIKFGNNPATLVTGKEAYMKRAEAHPMYDGAESGVIVIDLNGEIAYRNGTVVLTGENIVGAWAVVYRKDRNHPTRCEVSFDEYAGYKKDGTLNSQWRSRPATMIRKVALVQALREAFPATFGAMYTAEEQGFSEDDTAAKITVQPDDSPVEVETATEQKPVDEGDGLPL